MNLKHGHVISSGNRSPTLNTWHDMIRRTTDIRRQCYHRYGGRGITVCDRWKDFKNFLEDMGERPPGLTLERLDNSEGYCRENCKWATQKEQARNRRTSKIISYNGKKQSLAAWCEELGLNYSHTLGRINKCNWPVEKAFTTTKPMFIRKKGT
jgi:hypothetical protein